MGLALPPNEAKTIETECRTYPSSAVRELGAYIQAEGLDIYPRKRNGITRQRVWHHALCVYSPSA